MILKRVLPATFLIALVAAAHVHAATLISDHFNYANGDLTITDGTGANVSGGAWVPFSGQSFTAESITVVNNKAELLISGSEDASRAIPNAATDFMTAGETWYYGGVVTVNDQRANPATTGIVNEYFMLLKDTSAAALRARLYVANPSTGVGGAGFRFGVGASSGAANAVNWGTDLAFGVPYQVIVSYEFNTGFAKLWVNPVNSGSTSVTATASPNSGTFISELGLRQAFSNGGVAGGPSVPNTQILIDAVSLAESFNEALAALTVPEPTSAMLGLMGLCGMSLARRKRMA